MKTKVTLILLLFLLLSLPLFSQIDYKAELAYLETVNSQNDKFLIKDNLRNAEIVADSLIWGNDSGIDEHEFFALLSRSYFIIGDYTMAIISALRAQLLFPAKDERLYDMVLYSLKKTDLSDPDVEVITAVVKSGEKMKEDKAKLELLKYMILLENKSVTKFIENYSYNLRNTTLGLPLWVYQWDAMTLSGIKISRKKQALDFSSDVVLQPDISDIISGLPEDVANKVRKKFM